MKRSSLHLTLLWLNIFLALVNMFFSNLFTAAFCLIGAAISSFGYANAIAYEDEIKHDKWEGPGDV